MGADRAGFGLVGDEGDEGVDVVLFLFYERADFGEIFTGFCDVWILCEGRLWC